MNIYTDKNLSDENIAILEKLENEINKDKPILDKMNIQITANTLANIYDNYRNVLNGYYKPILENVCNQFAVDINQINRAMISDEIYFRITDKRFEPIRQIVITLKQIMSFQFDKEVLKHLDIKDNVATIKDKEKIINIFTYNTKNEKQQAVTKLLNGILPILNNLKGYGITDITSMFYYDIKGNIIGINKDSIYRL